MAPPFQQTTVHRHSHSSPPSHKASVYLSLLVVAMFSAYIGIPWIFSYISQMFWTLFLKKRMEIFIAVVIVFLVYCAFLSGDDDNNNENTKSCYNELQASNYWVPTLYRLQEEREEDNLQLIYKPTIKKPRRMISRVRNLQLPHSSPPPQLPVIQQRNQESDGNKEKKKKIQKRVKKLDTIRNPQTPSTLKPPLPNKANRSNRRFYNVSLGSPISSPSPQQATAQKPVSPVNSSSFSSEYEKMSSSSTSNSSPFNLPPPIPPFKISQWKWKMLGDVAILRSNSSSSGDSPITKLYFSSDVDAKAERFIENFNADLEKQRRGRSNRARLRTERKKEKGRVQDKQK